jgi:hypothetical protein
VVYNIAIIHTPNSKLTYSPLSEKMVDFTNFYIQRLNQNPNHHYTNIECDDYNDGLSQITDEYDFVLLISSGNRFYNTKYFMESIINEFNDDPKLCIMGHILDRKNEWYEIHQQFVVIRVPQWISSQRPSYGYEGHNLASVIGVERSEENFHDDYTPTWVRGTGSFSKSLTYLKDGWSLMNGVLMGGYSIKPLPTHIRRMKSYCYPEYNSEKFYSLIKNKEYSDTIDYTKKVLLSQLLLNNNGAWVFNTEEMLTVKGDTNGKFEVVALPCAGFKFLDLLLRDLIDEHTKTYFYDFSGHSVYWFDYLMGSSDTDIIKLLKNKPEDIVVKGLNNKPIFINGEPTDDLHNWVNDTYNYFGGFNKFSELLKTYRGMDIEIIHTNIVEEPHVIKSRLNGEYNFINVSNIYSTDYLNLFYDKDERNELFNKLTENLQSKTLVVGRGPDTYYFEKTINDDNR